MRIHYLQHVPFEDPGSLLPALANLGHGVAGSHPYRGDPLPRVDDFDALIIMGGPMGAEDEAIHPWLAAEKALIGEVCRHTAKPVLGICLGAQLIASALGAPVTRNPQPEIGWFPLHLDDAFAASPWGQCFDDGAPVFHWHGDTFALPAGAQPLGHSEACRNQGFVIDDRIVGLQFHLETTSASAAALIEACGQELAPGPFVQSAEAIMADPARFEGINRMASRLVSLWLRGAGQ